MSTQTYKQHGQYSKQKNGFSACYFNLKDQIYNIYIYVCVHDFCNSRANRVHAGCCVLAKYDSHISMNSFPSRNARAESDLFALQRSWLTVNDVIINIY